MEEKTDNYGLDSHCSEILNQYRKQIKAFEKLKTVAVQMTKDCLKKNGIYVTAIEGRIKEEDSLAGKLVRKGYKYNSLNDITDIFGARIIALYTDDVDKIAALIENLFEIDWQNSVDKRRISELNRFGYSSLHYICKLPPSLSADTEYPSIGQIRFEIQIRTTLQHVWSSLDHDIGYKAGFEVPEEHLRRLNILAGMLELADSEFSRMRTTINNYRRQVMSMVGSGKLDEVPLDKQTFENYLQLKPFDTLNRRIAAINQAEVMEVSLMSYLHTLKKIGLKTLGDVERMKKECNNDAYELARHHIGKTDLDIVTSVVGLQNLCIVYVLRQGQGKEGLVELFNEIKGPSPRNITDAEEMETLVKKLSLL